MRPWIPCLLLAALGGPAAAQTLALPTPGQPNAALPTPGTDDDPLAPPPNALQPGTDPNLPAWAQPSLSRPVPQRLTEEEARQRLEAQGYYDIRNLQKVGDNYTADARQYGKEFSLTIDGHSGDAVPKQE